MINNKRARRPLCFICYGVRMYEEGGKKKKKLVRPSKNNNTLPCPWPIIYIYMRVCIYRVWNARIDVIYIHPICVGCLSPFFYYFHRRGLDTHLQQAFMDDGRERGCHIYIFKGRYQTTSPERYFL